MTSTAKSTQILTNSLQGKVALVTGAGRGIGRACVEALAREGARVIAVARTASDLQLLENTCAGQLESWPMDITSEAFYTKIEQQSKLDILVNNAGTNHPQAFTEVDVVTLSTMITLNIEAAFRTAQSTVRVMRRQQSCGSIINMSSQMGHVGSPNRSVYCMTKHAIEGLTKALAVELAPFAIRVNAVAPTFVETPLTRPMFENREFRDFVLDRIPIGHIAQPEDIAEAVVFLASEKSNMITGDSLKIDGGWTAQ